LTIKYPYYISYARGGKGDLIESFASELIKALEDKLALYFNEPTHGNPRLEPGYNFEEWISQTICESACMIVIYTPTYEDSVYCLREFLAMERIEEKRRQLLGDRYNTTYGMILPIILRVDTLPPKLRSLLSADLSKVSVPTQLTKIREFEETLDSIVERIYKIYNLVKDLEIDCTSFSLPSEQEAIQTWSPTSRPTPPPPSPIPVRGPSPHIITDKWTIKDTLGYKSYARAIARFITHPKTSKPLCISIQAPWGHGKTSLMRMIQDQLDHLPEDKSRIWETTRTDLNYKNVKLDDLLKENYKKKAVVSKEVFKSLSIQPADESGLKPCTTVWFNAWTYENTEQVWSGLANRIVEQVSIRLGDTERMQLYLELHTRIEGENKIEFRINERIITRWKRALSKKMRKYVIAIGIASLIAAVGWIDNTGILPLAGVSSLVIAVVLASLQVIQEHNKAETEIKKEPAQESLGGLVNQPDYNRKSVFLSQVVIDIQTVLQKIPKEYLPMVIFIDDLDRCSPNNVINIIEAVNLFLGGGYFSDCVFVIGMDAEMVAAALGSSYGKVITYTQEYSSSSEIGWRFMDKFVQLPFAIPPADKNDISRYINTIFLNERLATKKKLELKSEVDPGKSGNLKDNEESLLINAEIEEGQNTSKLNEMIDAYSEEDPEIQKIMLKYAHYFSNSPRDLKRLMNVFRFYYFISLARLSRGSSSPAPEQLIRWIILLLKWPQFARWLQSGNGASETDSIEEKGRYITVTGYRLMKLENISRTCKNNKDWHTKIKNELRIDSTYEPWIRDEGIWYFLRREPENEKKRLSSAAGKGFY
jgi:hypothetical protein